MYTYNCIILKIIDGDTVDVLIDLGCHVKIKERIRLWGINAPERFTEEGKLSSAKLAELLPIGTECVIETYKSKDKYGRYLGIIHNKKNINTAMVEEGFAKAVKGV